MFPLIRTHCVRRHPLARTRTLAAARCATAFPGRLARSLPLMSLVLLIAGGCADSEPIAPVPLLSRPHFAQGDGGVWTVTSLGDPGNGTCDDDCTLREAIAAAQSSGKIVFGNGLSGDILLTGGQLEIIDKSISIDGASRIAVDAQGNSRVLLVHDAAQSGTMVVELTGLVLRNGVTTGVFDVATAGGGLHIDGADVSLIGVSIADSRSAFNGGGVAAWNGSVLTVERSSITGNEATGQGGGIWAHGSTLEVVNTTIFDNTDHFLGGGVSSIQGATTITGSTIAGNHSVQGGGIGQFNGTLQVARSTISGNTATVASQFGPTGGGIAISGSTVAELRSVTITGNTGIGGAGGQNVDVTSSAKLTMSNSIVGGGGTAGAKQCSFTSTLPVGSGGFNLVSTECAAASPLASDIIVEAAVMYAQVLDPTLKDNGGATRTHALWGTGLAVDAGFCPSASDAVDQRGSTRPVDIASRANVADGCDIGAYEVQAGAPLVADLIVSQSVDKTSVKQGELLTYTVRVRNLGPNLSGDVVVSNELSSGVTFVAARPSKGTTTAPLPGETGTVTWNVGVMENGDDEVAEIQVTVLVRGKTTITNVATVSGNTTDPVQGNNTASITVTVASGAGGTSGGKGGGPKK